EPVVRVVAVSRDTPTGLDGGHDRRAGSGLRGGRGGPADEGPGAQCAQQAPEEMAARRAITEHGETPGRRWTGQTSPAEQEPPGHADGSTALNPAGPGERGRPGAGSLARGTGP